MRPTTTATTTPSVVLRLLFYCCCCWLFVISKQQQQQLLPTAFAFVTTTTTTSTTTLISRHDDSFLSTQTPSPLTTRMTTTTTTTTKLFMSDNPASSLLYKEQEKLLITQGEREAEWMKDTWTPIESPVIRGAGGGGGFGGGGGGGKGKSKKGGGSGTATSVLKAQAKAHAQTLREEGVVRIDNIFTPKMADTIRENIMKMKEINVKLVEDGKVPSIELFANVLLKNNRWDMTVPIGGEDIAPTNDSFNNDDDGGRWVAEALQSILMTSPVGLTMANLLTPKAVLYELSTLISDPGSERQVVHPDTPNFKDGDPVLYTCFIALQDVEIDMGPTTWIPKTHMAAMHMKFKDESILDPNDENCSMTGKEQLLRTQPSVLGLLPKGSCGIFDSRLLHAGGANMSDKSRALFYCSFKNPTVVDAGNPGSIRKNMIDQWTLDSLQKELKRFAKGKSCNLVKE